jgi:hypothetical protein
VDHYIWLDRLEDGKDGGEGRDVAIKVLHAVGLGAPIARRAQVEYGDAALVGFEKEVDDVVAQEAATADHEDFA